MTSRASHYRHKMKREDPKAYRHYLDMQKVKNKAARAEEKRKWEEEPHTPAQIMAHEMKLKEQRERQRANYYKKKAERERQTRNSRIGPKRKPNQKRPKDMDPDELRVYNNMMRRKQRAARSSQKRTADNIKQRRRRQEKMEQLRQSSQLAKTKGSRALKHEFKSKSKKMQLSNEEYAKAALSLLNPRTPDKRTAIASLQRQCPSRVSAMPDEEVTLNLEGESGIDVQEETTPDAMELEESCPIPLHQHIQTFYREEVVSQMLPHPRYITEHGAARVMTMTTMAAYTLFKERNPDIKVDQTLFQQQRPVNVRLLGSVPIDSCLCVRCTNVRLKILSLNRLLGQSGKLPSEDKFLNLINCPVSKRWNDIVCIHGKCDSCRDRLRPIKIFCRDILDIASITWRRWCQNESDEMEPVSVTGSVIDLLEEFTMDLEEPSRGVGFAQHLFTAYWQYEQYKMNQQNPADGEIIMVHDFAENRKVCYAEEIKSAHLGKGQIIVHPMVCFYRKGEEIVRHTIILFSDDIDHDFHAVNSFTLAALDILKKERSFTSLTIWSDYADSRYEVKGSFADLPLLTGLDVQRCFFGAEHGKGEADSEVGVLSQIIRRASMSGQSFAKAQDMVTFLNKRYRYALNTDLKKRQYIVLNEINRDRPETEVQTIPDTHLYHQFKRLAANVIQARRFACFCTGCLSGSYASCLHKEYVGEFVTHTLKPRSNTDDSPEVRIGDYLRLTCEINRLKKTFYVVFLFGPSFSRQLLQLVPSSNLTMLSADLDGQNGKDCDSSIVAQDVLLSKGMSSPKSLRNTSQAMTPNIQHYSGRSLEGEDGHGAPSTVLEACTQDYKCGASLEGEDLTQSQKEEERRQKLRERKRIQRLNQDFAEKERLRARGRIKALRQDPVFRQNERQRDKERRRKARLLNQNQRIQEKERDKLHKSLMRSLMGDGSDEIDSRASLNGVAVDVNNWSENDRSDTNVINSYPSST